MLHKYLHKYLHCRFYNLLVGRFAKHARSSGVFIVPVRRSSNRDEEFRIVQRGSSTRNPQCSTDLANNIPLNCSFLNRLRTSQYLTVSYCPQLRAPAINRLISWFEPNDFVEQKKEKLSPSSSISFRSSKLLFDTFDGSSSYRQIVWRVHFEKFEFFFETKRNVSVGILPSRFLIRPRSLRLRLAFRKRSSSSKIKF